MTFLEGLALVGSSATIFGVIMGIFTFFNGRITRKEISRLIKESRESTERLITESRESTERLIHEIHNSLQQSIERIQQSIEAADKRRSEDTKYLAELISRVSQA